MSGWSTQYTWGGGMANVAHDPHVASYQVVEGGGPVVGSPGPVAGQRYPKEKPVLE